MVLAIVLATIVSHVFQAWGYTETVDGLEWTYAVSNGEASVGKDWWTALPTSTSGSITIPSKLGGHPVTSVSDWAFNNCSKLTSVTIPDSVTNIGHYAFHECAGLTNLNIGNGVRSVGWWAFDYCSGLTSVTIPENVICLGSAAFEGCAGLKSVTIMGNITNDWGDWGSMQGSGPFYLCTNIENIVLSQKMKKIGSFLFRGCSKLKTVTIPSSVTNLGDGAFSYCSGLTKVTIPNCVKSIGDSVFSHCTSLKSVTFPSSVKHVGICAFSDCTRLSSVTFSNYNADIGSSAFHNCHGLKTVHASDLKAWCTLSFEDAEANPLHYANHLYFSGQEMAGDVVISTNITRIGNYVFADCIKLTGVTIGDGITSIGDGAFSGCSNLNSVSIFGNVTNDWDFENGDYSTSFPFYNCTKLGSIHLAGKMRKIGERMFCGCSSLTNVAIDNGVEIIGKSAFRGCSRLKSLVIPESVTELGDSAFSLCYLLTTLYVPMAWRGTTMLVGVGLPEGCQVVYGKPGVETVIFDANGGVCGITAHDYATGVAHGWLPEATLEGCVFTGWWTMSEGGERVTENTLASVEGVWTLFAHWTPEVLIRFHANGGEGTMADQTFAYGSPVALQTNAFQRESWVFAGWSLSEDGAVVYADGAVFPGTGSVTDGVLHLYAVWRVGEYAVRFAANGGSGEMANQMFTIGQELALAACAFSHTGFRFAGWATEETGGVVYGEGQVVSNLTTQSGGVVTLYATWAPLLVAAPEIAPPDGTVFVGETCEVAISCATEGAIIYFTTDGTTPRIAGAFAYTAPFKIDGTTTVKAIAMLEGVRSEYAEATLTQQILTLAEAAGAPELPFATGGNAEWRPVIDESTAGGYAAESGAVGPNSETWMEATVPGAGTFKFDWRVDCEKDDFGNATWDHLAVSLDGDELQRLDGMTDWATVTLEVEGEGDHSIRWTFAKDGYDDDGAAFADRAWVAGVVWTPEDVPKDSFPVVENDAGVSVVLAEAADERLGEKIASVEAYDDFRAWVAAKGLAPQEVKDSPHAWPSYLLGADALFDNEPEIRLDGVKVVESSNRDGRTALSVEVTVRDGDKTARVDAAKVAGLVGCTGDLNDWDGPAKLEPTVTQTGAEGDTLRFEVVPGDGNAEKAFLRIAE